MTRPNEKQHTYALAMQGYAPIIRGAAAAQFARGYMELLTADGKMVKVEVVGMRAEGDTIVTTVRMSDEVAAMMGEAVGPVGTSVGVEVSKDGVIHVHPPKPVPPPVEVDQPLKPYDAHAMRGRDGVPVYDLPTSQPRPDLHRPGPPKHPLEGALHKKGGIGSRPTTPKPNVVPSAQASRNPTCECGHKRTAHTATTVGGRQACTRCQCGDFVEALTCTCGPGCTTPGACKGVCGCEACRQNYADFLSVE